MPYIKQEARSKIIHALEELAFTIKDAGFSVEEMPGVLNYVISSLLNLMRPEKGWNYYSINNTRGLIGCVGDEFYRRVAAPYEDIKIQENGDIRTFK